MNLARLDPSGPGFDAEQTTPSGSTVTVKDDAISANKAGALGRTGWSHEVLHTGRGDTKAQTLD